MAFYLFLVCLVYFQVSMQGTSGLLSRTTSNTKFVKEPIPEECQALGYCEVSKKHPENLAKKLVEQLRKADVPLDSDANETVLVINNRFGFDGESVCEHTSKTITPFMIKDMADGTWYYTVNTKENPIYQYKVQICAKPTSRKSVQECSSLIIMKDDYDSQCIQKNITRTIQVVKHGKPYPILTSIPCCCTCVAVNRYKQNE